MPTFKPVLREYQRSDNKYRIYIRIIHKRKVLYIPTEYYIEEKCFKNGKATAAYPLHLRLNKAINLKILEFEGVVIDNDTRRMTVYQLRDKLTGTDDSDFIKFMEKRIKELQDQGRAVYATSYQAVLNHICKIATTLHFSNVNLEFFEQFKAHLIASGVSNNSQRVYIERVKAILYLAKDREILNSDLSYLRKVKVKTGIFEKRALNIHAIRRLRIGPYQIPAQEKAVDLFFLVLYLTGINLKDLLYITPEQVYDGRLHYNRSKTKHPLSIKIFPQAEAILNRYKGSKYLLYFLDENDSHDHYRHVLANLNKQLRLATTERISLYSARHSVASLMSELDIPIETISYALGHSQGGARITQTYIKFNFEKVDQAMEKVINLIRQD